jgi:hypothetical protein
MMRLAPVLAEHPFRPSWPRLTAWDGTATNTAVAAVLILATPILTDRAYMRMAKQQRPLQFFTNRQRNEPCEPTQSPPPATGHFLHMRHASLLAPRQSPAGGRTCAVAPLRATPVVHAPCSLTRKVAVLLHGYSFHL